MELMWFITEPAPVRQILVCRRASNCTGNLIGVAITAFGEWTSV